MEKNIKLNWKPEGDFEERLKETIDWYKNNEWFWKPLKEEAEKFYKKIGR